MATVTFINQKTRLQPGNAELYSAIRKSVCSQCRVQLMAVCADFFDVVDDYLFASGSKGQFAEDSSYLKAMRELRTKQSLFEEVFLEITTATLFSCGAEARNGASGHARHLVERHAESYQLLEVDLALQAMQRKADKIAAPYCQQIDALLERVDVSGNAMPHRFALVQSSMWAFGEAQRVFALPLEIRLIVIKLFEQHFMPGLKLQFLDAITVIKQALVEGAVDRRFPAASPIRSGHSSRTRIEPFARTGLAQAVEPAANAMQSIELAVDAAVTSQCEQPGVPRFVADMLRCKWRTVLFLVGVHRGCFGSDWQDAIGAMQLLVDCSVGQDAIDLKTMDALLEQLRNGFALLQMPLTEQVQFEDQLRDWLQQQSRAVAAETPAEKNKMSAAERNASAAERNTSAAERNTSAAERNTSAAERNASAAERESAAAAETSVSPSGKQILDCSDLEEITSLLGTDNAEISTSAIERELIDCLPDIDHLREDAVVEYRIDGEFQLCSVQKNPSNPGMFSITGLHSKTTITRSRLGLAISLHQGELKFPEASGKTTSATSSQRTVINRPSSKALH